MRRLALTVLAPAMFGLAGCIGAPAPGPVVYAPGSYTPPGAPVAPGYATGYAPGTQLAYSGNCYAGVYTCTLPQALPVGSQCACPGLGAPSYGAVR